MESAAAASKSEMLPGIHKSQTDALEPERVMSIISTGVRRHLAQGIHGEFSFVSHGFPWSIVLQHSFITQF